jgi:hypothetical protein
MGLVFFPDFLLRKDTTFFLPTLILYFLQNKTGEGLDVRC